MVRVAVSARWANDRRHSPRVRLAVPVQVARTGGEEGGALASTAVQSRDLSLCGLYVIVAGEASVAPGEVLTVSVSIPWECRRAFPFSRVAGSCRVVRVEPAASQDGPTTGVALAFCGDGVTQFGSALIPG